MDHDVVWYHARTTHQAGVAVRDQRVFVGLTQSELAAKAGITRMTLSRLERGQSVGLDNLLAVLTELGLQLAVVPAYAKVEIQHSA